MGKDTVLEYVHIVCLVNTPNTTIYDTIFHARTLPDLFDTFQPFDHQQHISLLVTMVHSRTSKVTHVLYAST